MERPSATRILRDLLDAEQQLTKTLPKLAKAACSDEISTAFEFNEDPETNFAEDETLEAE